MKKQVLVLSGGLILTLMLVLLSGCNGESTDPPGWGINNFPDPKSFTREWNNSPNLPNPFVSWQGMAVNAGNWELRREEISTLLQHYMTGYKHPDVGFTSEIISVGAANGNNSRLLTIEVTREETGATGRFYASVNVPTSGTPPTGGWPVVMTVSMSNSTAVNNPSQWSALRERGYASMHLPVYTINAGDESGAANIVNAFMHNTITGGVTTLVSSLFPEVDYWDAATKQVNWDSPNQRWDTRYGWIDDYGDLDAPVLIMNWVWGISRLLDALEAYNEDTPAAERDFYINPAMIAVTGASRMGKLSMFAAAFEERIAMSAPADSCAYGPNIDRFVSVSVNAADSRTNFTTNWRTYPSIMRDGFDNANWPPYNPDKESGFGPFDSQGPLNKYYYYVKFEEVLDTVTEGFGANQVIVPLIRSRVVTAGEALIDPTKDLDGGVTKAFPNLGQSGVAGHVLWKNVPALTTAYGALTQHIDNDATNLKDGYGVAIHAYNYNQLADQPSRAWAGQNIGNMAWLYPMYFSGRFHQIPIMYPDLNIHARQEQGNWGYYANLPFDMHYVTALIAPRPLLMFGGLTSSNAGTEAQFMGWLATREVYRLLGAEDNIGLGMYMHAHTQPAITYMDIVDFWEASIEGVAPLARYIPNKVEEYPYAINDPRSRFDYVKLNWAAPGYESIASQVERLVPANATSWDQIKITDN